MNNKACWSTLSYVRLALMSGLALACTGPVRQPAAATGSVAAFTEVEDGLAFLVIGDWGRQGQHGQTEVAVPLAEAALRLDAQFIVSTGDNFYPNGVASTGDPNWRLSFEEPYRAHALWIDWWPVLGNHDYRGDPDAQVAYSRISRRWRLPARYHAAEFGVDDTTRALIAFIDTSPLIQEYHAEADKYFVAGQDTVAQLRWLDSTLAASSARWKFVVGHHQVYSGGKRTTQPELERLLVPIMTRRGVRAYFNGHEHDLQHIVRPGGPVHYFVSGAGSEVRPTGATEGTRFAAAKPGFLAVVLRHERMQAHFVDARGRLLYTAELAPAVPASTAAESP